MDSTHATKKNKVTNTLFHNDVITKSGAQPTVV